MPARGPMMDVPSWLARLGLSRYAQLFSENHIDESLLRDLSVDDLKELGIASLGHRKRLLEAIAGLDTQPWATLSRELAQPGGAERRQLTVMFVDLVDSTALAARLDPEDMSEVLHVYQKTVAGEINRFEGYVAKLMGDGTLAYFGWPRTHEDEAERAVRAALKIVFLIGRLVTPANTALAARAGIATGMVVVGEIIGEGAAREETAVGETLSLAARLQALAPPGGVLIAEATRRLLGGLFALAPLGQVQIKGFEKTLPAWRVLGEATLRGRFEAHLGGALAPMVGREKEQALLLQRWEDACGGEGQAFVLVGEAGIGKSRLLRGLRDAISAEEYVEIHWQCSPFHWGTPLQPVLQDFAHGPPDVTVAALEQQFAESGVDAAEGVPLLAAVLGIAPVSRYPMSELSPEAQRSSLLSVLLQHLLGLAARRPLLVVLEDAHWADASTLELVRLLSDRMASSAILMVITSRPEGLPPMPNPPHLTRLMLGRLGRAAVAAMIASTVSGGQAETPLLDTILSRTDGVPLFVEELSKALVERGSALVHADGTLDVPASLHDTLMARLDRLPGQKEVAQIAACIGREFDHRLLAAIVDKPETDLCRGLEQLCEAELLFRRGTPPEASYSFKHALVRDAAYESLLKSRRRTIHARLLAAIENDGVPAAAEETAQHAAAAGLWAKALHYYGLAGKVALDRAANTEGLALIAKAIEAGGHVADDMHAQAAMIDLRRARGWAYLTMGDTPRVMTELRDAETSAARFGLGQLTCELCAQRAHVETIFGGTMRRALRYGRDAARIAAKLEDRELSSVARFVQGLSFLFAGEYRSAVAELMVDAEVYLHGLRMAAVGSSGTLAVDGLAVLGDALGQLGLWEEALARGAEAQTVAADTGIPWDMQVANYHLARTLLARRDARSALPLITWDIDFGERCGLPMVVQWHHALLGHAYMLDGRHDEAIDLLDRAIAGCTEMQLRWTSTYGLLIKAETLHAAGRAGAAVPAAEALSLARKHGYRAFEAGARRVLALCARRLDLAASLRHLAAARAIAVARGMTPELQAIKAAHASLK